jgi:Holliday junction resolvase RusA-like endonuclease
VTEDGILIFSVDGDPVPKQSFQVGRAGGTGQTSGYTPPRVKAWQKAVSWMAHVAWPEVPMTGPVMVVIEFRLRTHRRQDLDNLSKAILDALNGVVWEDDKQVIDLHLRKVYDRDKPGITVGVKGVQKWIMPPLF